MFIWKQRGQREHIYLPITIAW